MAVPLRVEWPNRMENGQWQTLARPNGLPRLGALNICPFYRTEHDSSDLWIPVLKTTTTKTTKPSHATISIAVVFQNENLVIP